MGIVRVRYDSAESPAFIMGSFPQFESVEELKPYKNEGERIFKITIMIEEVVE